MIKPLPSEELLDVQDQPVAASARMPVPAWRAALSALLQEAARWLAPPLQAADELRDRLGWLAWLRWLVCCGQLACVATAVRLQFVPEALAPVLLGLIALLALANLYACRSLHAGRGLLRPETGLLAWLLFDWVQFVLLLSLNHGIANPFYPLVYVHAVLGAVLLPGRLSWALLAMMGLSLYLLNPVVYIFNAQQTFVRTSALVGWGIQAGVLLSVWGIAGWTSRRLMSWRSQAEALRHRQQSLQRIHLLGAMGAGVAHEFATPLNTLRLRLRRLQRDFAAEQHPDLQAALRALDQCEARLRSMAALPTQAELAHVAPLRVADYLVATAAAWQAIWPGIELASELDAIQGLQLPLPELALRQALKNLLDNAAQAMQGQGLIALRASAAGRLCLEIADTGPGWPDEILAHVGEPFVTTRAQGTGLGLYSVHMLAQSLGGSLELLPNHPRGACVRLCLPLK